MENTALQTLREFDASILTRERMVCSFPPLCTARVILRNERKPWDAPAQKCLAAGVSFGKGTPMTGFTRGVGEYIRRFAK